MARSTGGGDDDYPGGERAWAPPEDRTARLHGTRRVCIETVPNLCRDSHVVRVVTTVFRSGRDPARAAAVRVGEALVRSGGLPCSAGCSRHVSPGSRRWPPARPRPSCRSRARSTSRRTRTVAWRARPSATPPAGPWRPPGTSTATAVPTCSSARPAPIRTARKDAGTVYVVFGPAGGLPTALGAWPRAGSGSTAAPPGTGRDVGQRGGRRRRRRVRRRARRRAAMGVGRRRRRPRSRVPRARRSRHRVGRPRLRLAAGDAVLDGGCARPDRDGGRPPHPTWRATAGPSC